MMTVGCLGDEVQLDWHRGGRFACLRTLSCFLVESEPFACEVGFAKITALGMRKSCSLVVLTQRCYQIGICHGDSTSTMTAYSWVVLKFDSRPLKADVGCDVINAKLES